MAASTFNVIFRPPNVNRCLTHYFRTSLHVSSAIEAVSRRQSSESTRAKAPELPKRPATPFIQFMTQQKDLKGMRVKELSKLASERWAKIDEDTKETMKEEFRTRFQQWKSACEEQLSTLTEEERDDFLHERTVARRERRENTRTRRLKAELKKLGKPKRPISQMAYYFQDRMLEWDHSGTVTKYVQQCGDHWKSLSEAEKMHYKKRAEADRGRYDTEMHAWETRMLADGRPELLRTRTLADERRREKQEVKEREGSD